MKMLALLVCAMVALNEAAVLSEVDTENEIAPLIQEEESHLVKRSCPAGWTAFNSRCFRYIPTAMSWARAERNCHSMGANLASVHSAQEYHEIQNIIVSITHRYGEAWLGGSDAEEEGMWLWSDGSLFNYRHCGGFNNYQGRQHCLQMNYGDGKCWDDTWCHVHLPYVCAKKP